MIEELYLVTVSRVPSQDEIERAQRWTKLPQVSLPLLLPPQSIRYTNTSYLPGTLSLREPPSLLMTPPTSLIPGIA